MSLEYFIYEAQNPDAVNTSVDRFQQEHREWVAKVEKSEEWMGGTALLKQNSISVFIDGYRVGHDVEIPDGWYRYAKDRLVRPHQGGKTEAAARARRFFQDLNNANPGTLRGWFIREFNIPYSLFTGMGIEPVDGVYYVIASTDLFEHTDDPDGNEHFRRIPTSKFFALKEQQDASDT